MNTIVKSIVIIAAMLAVITHASGCIKIKSNLTTEDLRSLAASTNRKALRGNGKIITKSIEAPDFQQVSAHRSAEVLLVEENVQQITVRADENVMPYVVITCQRGALEITLDDAIKSTGEFTFEVEVPMKKSINRLSSSSGAEIALKKGVTLTTDADLTLSSSSAGEIEGTFEGKSMELKASSGAAITGSFHATKIEMDASSAGEIEGRIMAEELTAHASSGASLELEGTVRKARLQASSAGDIDGEKLTTTECHAGASSGANIRCHCTGILTATASSGGSIRYSGNPTTDSQESSGGSVSAE